ncbi:unnamed protein product [Rotaria socialis]|uniref:DUF4817 domain-containing protein n=1 Tax=Rotaria socialis TaxID=392032 RepID=A0A821QF34_9BILA|nr:unnamed protein product [Rotaria socialis]CAF4820965.1 unnamed protein product [Rotaria socialis]
MSLYLTKEQTIFPVKQWWISGRNFRAVSGAFRNEFPDKKMPIRQAIYKLAKKFDDTGSVEDSPRSVRPTTVRTEENMQRVSETFAQNPRDANHLKSLIKKEFKSLNDNIELCQTTCRSVADRCQMCINAGGTQFEHLR